MARICILLGVVQKSRSLIVDHVLARQARPRLIIAKHCTLNLARYKLFLDNYFSIVLSSEIDRLAQRLLVCRARHSNRGSKVCGLNKTWQSNLTINFAQDLRRVFAPL